MLLRCTESGDYQLADGRELATVTPGLCTLLLPPAWCSITEVAVGAGEANLLRKTLPWRLEDTLLSAPEALHFAYDETATGDTAVVIADRQRLEQAKQQLAAMGVVVAAAHAELALLPWQQGQWTLWFTGSDQWQVRHGRHHGFATNTAVLPTALAILQNEQQAWPAEILCYAPGEVASALRTQLQSTLQALLVVRKPPPWHELVAAAKAVNVMQGVFAPPLPWRAWWLQWRVAAWMAGALLVLDIALTLTATVRLQRENAVVAQALTDEFRQWLGEAPMLDPVQQLRGLLATRGGGEKLLPLLTRMAPALGASATTVQTLDYDALAGELQLDVQGNSFAAIESLRTALQASGLQVELLGSTSEAGQSRARLKVLP